MINAMKSRIVEREFYCPDLTQLCTHWLRKTERSRSVKKRPEQNSLVWCSRNTDKWMAWECVIAQTFGPLCFPLSRKLLLRKQKPCPKNDMPQYISGPKAKSFPSLSWGGGGEKWIRFKSTESFRSCPLTNGNNEAHSEVYNLDGRLARLDILSLQSVRSL